MVRQLYREVNGDKFWFYLKANGEEALHRHIRPAVIRSNGDQEWYINGCRCRRSGRPAVEKANGEREWWIDGIQLTANKAIEQSNKDFDGGDSINDNGGALWPENF